MHYCQWKHSSYVLAIARYENQFRRIENCSWNAYCLYHDREQHCYAKTVIIKSFVVNTFKNPEKYKSKIQSQGRLQSNKIMFTCLTILLLSLPYIRKREPQFFTCGCSSCRIFWEANCFPTLLFLPVKIITKMRQYWHVT